ncbi:PAS domain S-box protein [uncultured Cyclobacterium sp.]|uniref:PAS domain S-box protein n=1 Tax=uncultured Cyclobacterium sp. TaxID=453820 RepID=UPI0030EBA678|tara:strand:- start:20677 stop:23316 length:2640 start_codon:yes stop_codon:yes gene_type:complete
MQASSKQIGFIAANHNPALLAFWDKNEICRFANAAYLEWYGKPHEDIIDKISKKELLGEEYEDHVPYIREALKGKKQCFYRKTKSLKNKSLHSEVTYTPYIENGEVLGFTAHITDKPINVPNLKTEKLFKDLLESAPDAILIVDSTGEIKMVNQQAENIFGYTKLEMLGKDITLLMPEGNKSKHKSHIEKFSNLSTIRPMGTGMKLYGKRKNGGEFRIEVSLSSTKSEDGILVMASVRDITDRIRIENELKESNRRNSIFIQQSPNAIAMLDKDMRYMAVSQKWLEDYDLKSQNLIGQSHYDLFPEIGEDWKEKHQLCLKGEIHHCDEEAFKRANGSTQWIKWGIRPWYVSENNIGGIIMHSEDITPLKENKREKKRIEKILERTNAIARIGTWEVDLDKEEFIWSKIIYEIHEVPEDFVRDSTSVMAFFKKGRSQDLMSKVISECIFNGTPYDVEVELLTAKGNEVWARIIGQSEFINGKCKRLYGILQDITSIKKVEIKLNKVNEELKAILDSGTVSIIGTDNEGTITHFNRGAEKMLKYSAWEVVGKKTPEVFHLKEEILKRGAELSLQLGRQVSGFEVIAETSNLGDHGTNEWTYIRKDGQKLVVLLTLTPLKNQLGETFGTLGIATDVNERVENQQKLKEAKANLEVLTEKLSSQNMQLANFAHITSHNLRAPVSNLNSLLQFYHTSEGQEIKDTVIDNFETVCKHLTNTLDNLVGLLEIQEEGSKKIEIIEFDEVLGKTKEMLVSYIRESGAQIIADFSKAPKITYNRIFLESIFLNLIGNAINYRSSESAPVIKLETDISYNRIHFTISDNGLGIDLKKHGKDLFGLHKTFHENSEAKGIGLFLTKNHIEAMGGAIYARSEVGRGTTFTIKF